MDELGSRKLRHIHLFWDNEEKTVLRREVDYGWTWAEQEIANHEMAAILDSLDHDVCTLVVQNYSGTYLPDNAILKISAMLPHKHRRVLLSVVVSQSVIARSIFRLVTKLYPRAAHLRMVSSVEEGRQLIEQHFSKVPS